ncbi:MAG: hypothetical protein IPJ81_03450 [Chitinophagaceae bacterium]|nr:hypothetical protein [Chitinophagaceae bacterium]
MAVGALSENWLFKELGDFHWLLLCNGLNTKSFNLKDELGNRLYATFVRIRIKFSVALDEFEENEEVSLKGKIKRFGNGMYFSEILLQSQKGLTKANLMTSFSIRNEVDNTKLMKSQPYGGLNTIEEYASFPEFGDEYRLVKKNIKKELKNDGNVFSITDNILFESEYKLNAFYDLNGVGLLYFAAYPIINDVSESVYFTKLNSGQRWEQDYYTIFRDIFYFANCNIDDSIEYKLHSYEFINNDKIKITSSLYRKSDGIIIARLFTIKKKK